MLKQTADPKKNLKKKDLIFNHYFWICNACVCAC